MRKSTRLRLMLPIDGRGRDRGDDGARGLIDVRASRRMEDAAVALLRRLAEAVRGEIEEINDDIQVCIDPAELVGLGERHADAMNRLARLLAAI